METSEIEQFGNGLPGAVKRGKKGVGGTIPFVMTQVQDHVEQIPSACYSITETQ